MAKLLSQFDDAPIEAPFALIERGKISETSVQDLGEYEISMILQDSVAVRSCYR